jgi:hypothetical protein
MQKYHFSGHLSPRPKGTEHAMCALSGDVYLAADVDARIGQLEHELDIRKAAVDAQMSLMAQIRTLTKSNARLRQKIDRLQRPLMVGSQQ